MGRIKDLTGRTFGRLKVTGLHHQGKRGETFWSCDCKCGGSKVIRGHDLGKTTSCGCFRRESLSKRRFKHGRSHSAEHQTWARMLDRCYNENCPQFHRYGGRGIRVCSTWRKSFNAFFKDMGERPSRQHSLDRINNNGPYSPKNCRWATRGVQIGNRRNTVKVHFQGKRLTIREWSEITGIDASTIKHRLYAGWPTKKALTLPVSAGRTADESLSTGWYKIPEYRIWTGMNQRCRDPNSQGFHRYGGRGIFVCDRWRSRGKGGGSDQEQFQAFLADMGPRPSVHHSLDRIDNDGPYSPSNCRWATSRDQSGNKSSNRLLTFRGKTACVAEMARWLGIDATTVASRLRRGWSVEEALLTPADERRLSRPDVQSCDKLQS